MLGRIGPVRARSWRTRGEIGRVRSAAEGVDVDDDVEVDGGSRRRRRGRGARRRVGWRRCGCRRRAVVAGAAPSAVRNAAPPSGSSNPSMRTDPPKVTATSSHRSSPTGRRSIVSSAYAHQRCTTVRNGSGSTDSAASTSTSTCSAKTSSRCRAALARTWPRARCGSSHGRVRRGTGSWRRTSEAEATSAAAVAPRASAAWCASHATGLNAPSASHARSSIHPASSRRSSASIRSRRPSSSSTRRDRRRGRGSGGGDDAGAGSRIHEHMFASGYDKYPDRRRLVLPARPSPSWRGHGERRSGTDGRSGRLGLSPVAARRDER